MISTINIAEIKVPTNNTACVLVLTMYCKFLYDGLKRRDYQEYYTNSEEDSTTFDESYMTYEE